MNDTPKNVRQIGGVDVSHKIYVEDYVITYTKELGEDAGSQEYCEGKTAVLLGHKKITDKDVRTYINGMVVIEKFDVSEQNIFTNEIWSSIYDVIKKYYEDEEVVGWLYIGNNADVEKDKRLLGIHTGNFLGKNLVFMHYNPEEKEEEFFDYMNNAFLKRKGFYIYYQKNDTMHNYMVAMSNQKSNEKECDDHVVKDIRDILNRRQEKYESKKIMKSVYAASMFVAAMALLVGTTIIYNYNNEGSAVPVSAIQSPRPTEASVPEEIAVSTEVPVSAEIVQPTETPVPEEAVQPTEVPVSAEIVQPTETPVPEDVVQPTEVPASVEVIAPTEATVSSFYIVKEGDTLGKISEQIYNSIYYIEDIKKINEIENENSIYAGQKLWLPDKQQ